jgi:hypothetical protein
VRERYVTPAQARSSIPPAASSTTPYAEHLRLARRLGAYVCPQRGSPTNALQ